MERKYYIFAIVWTILITFLSLKSLNNTPDVLVNIPNKDKIIHFMFYFVFVILWYMVFPSSKNLIKISIIAILYGIIIEVIQDKCTETRTADLFDVLANTLGAVTAIFVVRKNFSLKNLKKDH